MVVWTDKTLFTGAFVSIYSREERTGGEVVEGVRRILEGMVSF